MNWNQIVNKINPYIVKIDTPAGSGTGFLCLYSDNKKLCGIATALHVVDYADEWQQPIRITHHVSGEIIFLKESQRYIFPNWKTDSAIILFQKPEKPASPDAIRTAKAKILAMLGNLKDAMHKIDENMVNEWVKDLVIVQTFIGLQFQEAILKKAAEIKGVEYRLSEKSDESKGIDGYIGDITVSIKPDTYKTKRSLSEEIAGRIVYYKKVKNGIEVDYSEIL